MLRHRTVHLLERALEYRHLPVVLAVAAFVIMLPTLDNGLMLDDLIHRAILTRPSQLPGQLLDTGLLPENSGSLKAAMSSQFGFSRHSQAIKKGKDYGTLPWWTSDNIKGSLWRPLASFTHWLDYRLFPNSPALMHAHSILWFAAAIFLVAVLYRRLIGAVWVAGLAALLYLLDENNYFTVMFIANRHALLGISFGMLSLLAHHQWRSKHSLSGAIFAQVFLLLSLLSAEGGITTFAFVFAYALMLEQSNWRRRVLSLVPAAVIIVVWRIIYNSLGYGVWGSGLYLDPVNDPLYYALALLKRAPLMLIGQLSCISPDIMSFMRDSAKTKALFIAVVSLVPLFIIILPLLRKSRLARFWFTAMLLSVLPFCATAPSIRNLYFVGIAAFGLLAQFIAGLLTKQSWIPKSRLWQVPAWVICIVLLIVHLPAAAAGRIIAPRTTSFVSNLLAFSTQINSPPGLDKKDVVIINSPSPLAMIFTPFTKAYEGELLPQSIRSLAPAFRPLEIVRIDENTLLIKTRSGNLFTTEQHSPTHLVYFFKTYNDLFRSDRLPFQVGDMVKLPRLTIEVLSVDEKAMPNEVLYSFDGPLNDASLYWLWFNWENGHYLPFEVPAVGQTAEVAGPPTVSLGDAAKFLMNSLSTSY